MPKRFNPFYYLLISFFAACSLLSNNPEKVFETIALNGNKIPYRFESHFKEIIERNKVYGLQMPTGKDNVEMRKATFSEYVNYTYTKTFDEDIKKVKELQQTDETKPIIDAALEMFTYADEIYKNDFPAIAKMLDEGKSEEEVYAAIQQLEEAKGAELQDKKEKVMSLIIPYAEKHGVEYKTIELP